MTQITSKQQKEVENDIQVLALDRVIQRLSKREMKFSANEISVAPDGSTIIKEAIVESKSDDEVTTVDSSITRSHHSKVDEGTTTSIVNDERSKDVERKEFGWWIVFIVLGVYVSLKLLKRYKLI